MSVRERRKKEWKSLTHSQCRKHKRVRKTNESENQSKREIGKRIQWKKWQNEKIFIAANLEWIYNYCVCAQMCEGLQQRVTGREQNVSLRRVCWCLECVPATEVWGLFPVLISMKVPVPIVILTSPVSKQHSPNIAACWSAIYTTKTHKTVTITSRCEPSWRQPKLQLTKLTNKSANTHKWRDWNRNPKDGRIRWAEIVAKGEKERKLICYDRTDTRRLHKSLV